MAAISKRLQDIHILLPNPCDEEHKLSWNFSEKIERQCIDFFRYFVKNHQLLNIEYSAHCSKLARDLATKNIDQLEEQIKEALMLAEILEIIYRDYLIVPREAARLGRDKLVYKQLLASKYEFQGSNLPVNASASLSNDVRLQTLPANIIRHMFARSKRLMILAIPLVNDGNKYSSWIKHLDSYVQPFFAYAAWMFFVPRISVNLFLTGKHLLPGYWMSEKEKSLGWQTRLNAQMERRWLELGNDIPALIVTSLSCFVLIGSLAPIANTVATISLLYDVVLSLERARVETNRMNQLKAQYNQNLNSGNLSPHEAAETKDYLKHLENRWSFDKKRIAIMTTCNTILSIAFILSLPTFPPLLAIVAGAIAILTTVALFTAIKLIDKYKPVDKVSIPSNLQAHGFFNKPRRNDDDDDDTRSINDLDTISVATCC